MHVRVSTYLAAVLAVFCGMAANAGVVFEDHFDDVFLDKWTHISSTYPAKTDTGLAEDHEPYMHVYYGAMRAELSEELTSSFRVTFKWLMNAYYDAGYVWLMNSTGTQGYGVRWNGGQDLDNFRGGHVNIMKYNSTNEYERYREYTEPWNFTLLLGESPYISGDSTIPPFADFEFTWDGATGELTVSVTDAIHGVHTFSATDTDFASFSRIYVNAATDGAEFYLDDLRVSPVIEPATCQQVQYGGYEIPSDLDGDCYVNWGDFAIFAGQWLICNDPDDPNCISTW